MKNKVILLVMLVGILALGLGFISCSGNSLNGTWVADGYDKMGITFSGKNFTVNSNDGATANFLGHIHQAQDGTYSISGSQIEFKFSDGRIVVESFTRTENTITLRGYRLLKK